MTTTMTYRKYREQRQKELMTEEQYQQQKYMAEQRYLRDLGELREKSGASDVERQEVQDRQLDALGQSVR